MGVLLILPCLLLLEGAAAGYYKVRPPPPPPPHPAQVHYGPIPPSSRYHRPAPAPHYPPPPAPHYPSHHRYPPGRLPHSAALLKAGSVRHYTRHPPPPYHKPVHTPYAWKHGYNAFRAPAVKEALAASPPQPPTVAPPVAVPTPTYRPPFLREDEDKGPIHTIPAPNLGPRDKPSALYQSDYLHHKTPLHSTQEDLAAVLKHGVNNVNLQPNSGYQVTEDPSLHQPHSGGPSFFAPDPSPELPNIRIPPSTDPHSKPSNGQLPLDLYLQQEAEKNQVYHQPNEAADNQLTAQDLFNLLNYNPNSPGGLLPQAQAQQHVLQPNFQYYNQGLFIPQSQHLDAMSGHSTLTQQTPHLDSLSGQSSLYHQTSHLEAIPEQGLSAQHAQNLDSISGHSYLTQQTPHFDGMSGHSLFGQRSPHLNHLSVQHSSAQELPHFDAMSGHSFLTQQAHLDGASGQSLLGQQSVEHSLISQQPVQQVPTHNFAPQYQTFNYDEQTQQGAYGSVSFPASSMNLKFVSHHPHSTESLEARENYDDNDVEGSEQHNSYAKVEENEVAQQQTEVRKIPTIKDIPVSTKSYAPTHHYTVTGEATNQFTVTGTKSYNTNTDEPEVSSPREVNKAQLNTETNENPGSANYDQVTESKAINKPDENLQLQKSIQIYEQAYTSGDDLIKQEIKNLQDYEDDYTEEEKIVKEMAIGQPIQSSTEQKETKNDDVHYVDGVPYGARIRPKRF